LGQLEATLFNAFVRDESLNSRLRILASIRDIILWYGAKHTTILNRLHVDHECDKWTDIFLANAARRYAAWPEAQRRGVNGTLCPTSWWCFTWM